MISKYRGEVIVDIENERGNTIHSFEYNRGTHYSHVLNDLRAYFNDGTMPEAQSNLAKFLYQKRNPDQITDRGILAAAFESVAQNDNERDFLMRYKGMIKDLYRVLLRIYIYSFVTAILITPSKRFSKMR